MLNKKEAWNKIKICIKSEISESEFNTWFSNTSLKKFDKETAVIEVPNKYFASWLSDNYADQIQDYINKNFNLVPKIKFSYNVPNDTNNTSQENRTPRLSLSSVDGLNPSFRFDNFVTCSFNEFAYSSSLDVAENPGKNYNPLFIFSKMSLGKTHLINAIGNHAVSMNISSKIKCVTSDRFSTELSFFLKNGKIDEWREIYTNLDFLIIDDIHLLSGREKSQSEFISIFDNYHKLKKQIVVSSKQPPAQVSHLNPQLTSRLEWGLLLEIKKPDQRSKTKIIKKRMMNQNLNIPDDVSFFLANSAKDLKILTKYLRALETHASVYHHEINMSTAKSVIKHISKYNASIHDIQSLVTGYFNISLADLISNKKRRKYCYPRQIAMYLSRKLTDFSFNEIGKAFGNKDHSTVIYAVKRIQKDIESSKNVSDDIKNINSFFHES